MDLVALSFVASMWDLQAWSNANDCACRYYIVYQCNSTIFHTLYIHHCIPSPFPWLWYVVIIHSKVINWLKCLSDWDTLQCFFILGWLDITCEKLPPGNLTQLYIEHGPFVDYLPIKIVIWHSRLSVYQRVTGGWDAFPFYSSNFEKPIKQHSPWILNLDIESMGIYRPEKKALYMVGTSNRGSWNDHWLKALSMGKMSE